MVVVEHSHTRYELLREELGSVAFPGDGTDPLALEKAGANRADILIATTDRDETNLVACQIAKHVYQTNRTIALIKDPKNEPIFQILGIDAVINSTHLILDNLEEQILGRPLLRLMNLRSSSMELVSITIPEDANVMGQRLGKVELPPRSYISLVVKPSGVERPSADLILEAADEIIAVTPSGGEQTLYDILTGI